MLFESETLVYIQTILGVCRFKQHALEDEKCALFIFCLSVGYSHFKLSTESYITTYISGPNYMLDFVCH